MDEIYPRHHLAERSEATNQGQGPGSLDFALAAELGLIELLETIRANSQPNPTPALRRLVLSAAGKGESNGNPADWPGKPALAVAVWNPNNFSVFLGAGAGTGTLERALHVITANRLVVLPLADEVYSIGTAAANVAGGDAQVVAYRFFEPLAPAAYAI